VQQSLTMKMMMTSTSQRSFGAFANHRDTEDNLDESPFEFTDESYDAIKVLMKKYPSNYKSSCCLPALFIAQK